MANNLIYFDWSIPKYYLFDATNVAKANDPPNRKMPEHLHPYWTPNRKMP
jgi:hypothetical protein